MKSHPSGVRELKLLQFLDVVLESLSHPLGVRELKPCLSD